MAGILSKIKSLLISKEVPENSDASDISIQRIKSMTSGCSESHELISQDEAILSSSSDESILSNDYILPDDISYLYDKYHCLKELMAANLKANRLKGINYRLSQYEYLPADEAIANLNESIKSTRSMLQEDDHEEWYYKLYESGLELDEAVLKQIKIEKRFYEIERKLEKSLYIVGINSRIKIRFIDDGDEEVLLIKHHGYYERGLPLRHQNTYTLQTGEISHISPIGRAVLGAVVGEKVFFDTPNGKQLIQIVEIIGYEPDY